MTEYPLTDEERAVAKKAAKRYGLEGPSFMDVIDTLTPGYANGSKTACNNVPVIRRWHRVAAYAMDLVDSSMRPSVTHCHVCNARIVDRGNTVKYCSSQCRNEYLRHTLPECAAPGCTERVKRKRSKTCSRKCQAVMARGNTWGRSR